MKRFYLATRTCLAAPLVAVVLSAPVSAETSCDANMTNGSIAQITETHATVYTSVLIDAKAADVWATLTDFDKMAGWSTGSLQGMTGDIKDGGSVMITFIFGEDENGQPISNNIPHTLIYDEGERFGWSDPFPQDVGGGRDNHIYSVEMCGEQTLFVQSDEIVDNPYAANFVAQLFPMYQTFNAELKAAVEN
ncbi:SRPBCC family protein [Sulfitobacter aestuariivivens]|uniref:SRPBCC family protein n=1 Tax=Sulfitobacter aestuariivivens TaxID=2766981 RepID=A0A927D298_9RHOB|nr:SRPBCC family protein [Sulfitobacter aestuariivivens]MBD3663710.1 SRPBCC family protein [Sulfitobacter aestuariivivens]